MHFGRLFVLVAAVGAATMFASIGAAALPREPAQPGGSPVAFLAHIVRLLAANRYAQAWTSLNPWQQSLASLPAYVACESQSPIPGQLVSLQVLRLRHESVE